MDSIRERILQRIGANLALITAANGYPVDFGGRVYRDKQEFTEPSQLPAIVFYPRTEEATSTRYGATQATATVEVYAVTLHGNTAPSTIGERILASLVKCLGHAMQDDTTLQALAQSVTYTGGGFNDEYPDVAQQASIVLATFDVVYTFAAGDPYNQ